MKILSRLFLSLFGLIICLSAQSQTVNTASLIRELVDLSVLADYPDPAFSTKQFSSFDKRSQYPDYPGWFSNSDGFGGEPIPGFEKVLVEPDKDGIGEYLICDVAGPGAIVRLWTAWFAGEITMWLDEKTEPVYQGDAQNFFQHTYEAILGEPNHDNWSTTLAQNTAGYYPIPFAKKLRLVWKGKLSELHFYHLQVRFYDKAARIQTFNRNDIKANLKLLDQVSKTLEKPSESLDEALMNAPYITQYIKPGERVKAAAFNGPGAFTHLAVFVTAQNVERALRQVVMDIRFDGAPWGQIQSPIGDFFGAAPGINPYESLPFTVLKDGRMVCRFVMPYRDSAEVYFDNKGDQEVTVTMKIATSKYQWKPGQSMHFRARWRADHELLADPSEVKDLPYLLIRGKGRMVGAACFLMNPTFVPSSYGNWWGEGDEKIFIDDHLKAAFIGTGSEDYYNYAWSSSAIFTHAYCGQPRNDGPANRGFVTNYRWHILDNIPFEKSFDFYMELYSHRIVDHFSYARTIYTYAVPESHDDHIPISREDVRVLKMPANWWPEPDGWALNAIFYQVEDLVAGYTNFDEVESYLWSAGELAVWRPKKASDQLKLRVPIAENGAYMIALTVAKMPGSGSISVLLDGKEFLLNGQSEHDLNLPFRTVSRNLKSGNIELTESIHELLIKQNGDEVKPVGLDFIWVKKQ